MDNVDQTGCQQDSSHLRGTSAGASRFTITLQMLHIYHRFCPVLSSVWPYNPVPHFAGDAFRTWMQDWTNVCGSNFRGADTAVPADTHVLAYSEA